ncbi:hypothetical protein [Pseudonocardia spinosispora]|uniref:hypothetical protein n=1 Tax=Pseudonocardia spinosispora TaxID=103441 RepID=UPI00041BA334|nr:hypothetical protein [Pseudonocardia spinosispora]
MSVSQKQAGRGTALTVSLAVFTLFEIFALVINFLVWQQIVTHGQRNPEVPAGAMVLLVVALIALAGVWLWWRKAVYLLAAVVAVAVVYDSVFGLASLALLIRLVLIAALGWCIKQKWESFR